jgi:hypothetical protein
MEKNMLTKIIKYFKMKTMNKSEKQCMEIETLRAIESVRAELVAATRHGDMAKIREIHARLISLYAALNVHNIIVAIEHIDFKQNSDAA